jgi:hypothetical protein
VWLIIPKKGALLLLNTSVLPYHIQHYLKNDLKYKHSGTYTCTYSSTKYSMVLVHVYLGALCMVLPAL